MRTECYPFCARRCVSKKEKETGRELNGSLHRSLLCWFAFEPQWFYSLSIQWLLFSRWYRISCPLIVFFGVHVRSETRSSSSRKQAHEILMTVTIFFTTLTPNGLTRQIRQLFPWRYMEFIPKNASSNKGGLSSRVAWRWKFWIRSVHVICARLVDRSNYGPFSKSAPLRDPTSSPL